jgi:hypothetical protein
MLFVALTVVLLLVVSDLRDFLNRPADGRRAWRFRPPAE